jgi:hypothetical protein
MPRVWRVLDFAGGGNTGLLCARRFVDAGGDAPRAAAASELRKVYTFDLFQHMLQFMSEQLDEVDARRHEDPRMQEPRRCLADRRLGAAQGRRRSRGDAHIDSHVRVSKRVQLSTKRRGESRGLFNLRPHFCFDDDIDGQLRRRVTLLRHRHRTGARERYRHNEPCPLATRSSHD